MDYIGIIFLAIVFIYFIKGWKKGFVVNLLESLKTVLGFVAAFLLCKEAGAYLLTTSFGLNMIASFEEKLLGINEAFATIVTAENQAIITENIWEYLTIPASFEESIKELVIGYIANEPNLSIGYYIAKAITSYATVAAGFVLVLIVFGIVFWILLKIFKSLSENQGFVSRLLGGAVGVIRAAIFVGIICYVLNVFSAMVPSSGIGTFINNSINHELGISKFFFDHNIVSYILDLIMTKL